MPPRVAVPIGHKPATLDKAWLAQRQTPQDGGARRSQVASRGGPKPPTLNELADRYERRISIVGWSLGGIYARELAREFPHQVRQVVTLGSPFGAGYRVSGEVDPALAERLRVPPPVPSTAIYSRFDGLVPWAACREQETPRTENIEVPATHLGMGGNPLVFWAVADRLAQAEDEWKPFDRSGFHKWFYV